MYHVIFDMLLFYKKCCILFAGRILSDICLRSSRSD